MELEGSTNIRRKERRGLVEEFIVGAIFECETYKIRDVTDKFFGRICPDETTRRGIRTKTLSTSGAKREGNIAIVWTLRRQELEVSFSSSVALVVFVDKALKGFADLT